MRKHHALVTVAVATLLGLPFLTLPAQAAPIVSNASVESDADVDGVPDCWQVSGPGLNTSTAIRVPDAHSGSWAHQIAVLQYSSGARRLQTQMGTSACSPTVTPGHTYQLSAWYTLVGTGHMQVYTRDTVGVWSWWLTSSPLAPSRTWASTTYTTAPVPAGVTAISFGVALRSVGIVTVDDLALSDTADTADTADPSPSPSPSPSASSTAAPTVSPSPSPSPTATSTTSTFKVSVSGNRLVDGSGATVRLLGVNRSGTQYACAEGWGFFDGPSDAASINAMKAWGMTAVRVSLNEDCWLGINGIPSAYSGANYQSAIAGFVDRLNAAGLYVILDLHWNAPGTIKALDQQPMADRDHAPAFWSGVAGYFKGRPAVVFDLYNEPYPDSNRNTTAAWTCVRDGGTCPGVNFTAAGSQEMLDAVRNAGATNVVLVGGPQYAGTVDRWTEFKPADPVGQLAASIHIYYNTPANPEWAPCYLLGCWEGTIAPLAATTPVVIGEVGEHDCDSALMMPLLTWADTKGVSYLAWSWITGNCSAGPALITAYDGTASGEGVGVRSHLLSLPYSGWQPRQSTATGLGDVPAAAQSVAPGLVDTHHGPLPAGR